MGPLALTPDAARLYAGYLGEFRIAVFDTSAPLPVVAPAIKLSEPVDNRDLAVSSDGRLLFSSGGSAIPGQALLVIDLATGHLSNLAKLEDRPYDLALDSAAARAYLTPYGPDVVLVVDVAGYR